MKENVPLWDTFINHLAESLCSVYTFSLNGYSVPIETEKESITDLIKLINRLKENGYLTDEEYCYILNEGVQSCEHKKEIEKLIELNCK